MKHEVTLRETKPNDVNTKCQIDIRSRHSSCPEADLFETLADSSRERVTVVKLGVDNRDSNGGTCCFKIKLRTDTAEFTDMRITPTHRGPPLLGSSTCTGLSGHWCLLCFFFLYFFVYSYVY